jgi:O-antigen biosynthesis protein
MSWKRSTLAAATEITAGFFRLARWIKGDAFYWLRAEDPNYLIWLLRHKRRLPPAAPGRSKTPLISVLTPVHNTRPDWLIEAVHSVRRQTFGDWELLLIDDASTDPRTRATLAHAAAGDPRIRLLVNPVNRGIAASTNRGAEQARGDWLLLLDHDDLLYPDALATLRAGMCEHTIAEVLYADEDRLSPRGLRYRHDFKPAFSPSRLEMCNYILHPLCIRRAAWQRIGGMRPAFDGSQDYDLLLRLWDAGATIHHLPAMLYSWREATTSMAGGAAKPHVYTAGRRALQEHLHRRGEAGHVEDNPWTEPGDYRLRLDPPTRPRLLLVGQSRAPSIQGWQVDRILPAQHPIRTALAAGAEHYHAVIFLDPGLDTDDWRASLGELLGWCLRSDVGVVGGRVLDAAGRIVHAGLSLAPDGVLRADFRGRSGAELAATRRYRDCLAVNGVLGIAGQRLRSLASRLPDEDWMPGLCLNARDRGLRVVYNPFATFMLRDTPAVTDTNSCDDRALLIRHGIDRDPYLNPQLASTRWNDLRLPLQWSLLDRLATRHAERSQQA